MRKKWVVHLHRIPDPAWHLDLPRTTPGIPDCSPGINDGFGFDRAERPPLSKLYRVYFSCDLLRNLAALSGPRALWRFALLVPGIVDILPCCCGMPLCFFHVFIDRGSYVPIVAHFSRAVGA
jgi:hypothetical protein